MILPTDGKELAGHPTKRPVPRAPPAFSSRKLKRGMSINKHRNIHVPPTRPFLPIKPPPPSGRTPRLGMPQWWKSLGHVPILQSQPYRHRRALPVRMRISKSREMNMGMVVVAEFARGYIDGVGLSFRNLSLTCPFCCFLHFATLSMPSSPFPKHLRSRMRLGIDSV